MKIDDDTAPRQCGEKVQDADALALTLLRTMGPLATKRVVPGPDGRPRKPPIDRAKWFVARQVRFQGVRNLYALLRRLDRDRRAFVVRARPLPGTDGRRVRRLLHRDGRTGEGPYLEAVPRAWAAFDFDDVPCPAATDPLDAIACGDWLRGTLPEPFHDAACVVQATSGCGLGDGLRYRLWFVLDRPLTGPALKAWCASPLLVPCTLDEAEPIYTARPVFEGVHDPVPVRFRLLEGLEDAVPDESARFHLPERTRTFGRRGAGDALPSLGFDGWLALVGDGEGRDLDEADLAAVRLAFRRSKVAREIWQGTRTYPDPRRRRFAFCAALARAGVQDADALAGAVLALEERTGCACPPPLAALAVAGALKAEAGA